MPFTPFTPSPRPKDIGKGREMTMEEFEEWLKGFDTDGDCKISKRELEEALRSSGSVWFVGVKARRVLRSVDTNLNGLIDDNEIIPEKDGKVREMTMEEFKKWLKGFDVDGDGQISAQELREAIRSSGTGWFSGAKARRVLCSVDANSNGFIDDNEISKLLVFAHTQFGFTIVS